MSLIASIEGKIWMALKGRLDQWLETPQMQPNQTYNPQANQAFLIIQPVSLDYEDLVIGYDCGNEFRGFLNISPMVPLTWSYAQHAGLASRVCDHFQYGGKYSYLDCTVTINERPKITGAPRLDASWNRIDLSMPWRTWG